MRTIAILGLVAVAAMGAGAGDPRAIGPVEDFVLSADREAVLRKLVPGTADFYRLHLQHFEHTKQWDAQRQMVAALRETARREAIPLGEDELRRFELRAALLRYDDQPDASAAEAIRLLDLKFDASQPVRQADAQLASALPPDFFDRALWVRRALAESNGGTLGGFTPDGLDLVLDAGVKLDFDQENDLLQRITNPRAPGLPDVVARHLEDPRKGKWGQFPIHRSLSLAQMDELVQRLPVLRDDMAFAEGYIARLEPPAFARLGSDRAVTDAYLDRVLAFARTLPPTRNALKASFLLRRLDWDRKLGRCNRATVLEYLALPRPVVYFPREALEKADPDKRATLAPDLVPLDLAIVRAFALRILGEDGKADALAAFIEKETLARWLAEAMVTQGKGEPEDWVKVLGADGFAALRDRVDIEFDPTNPPEFKDDEPVKLALTTKNAGSLTVRIYPINTLGYHESHTKPIDATIDLDGLTPNLQKAVETNKNPFLRESRVLDLPEVKGHGVWVVELIGNGRANRCVLYRGELRALPVPHEMGRVAIVVDGMGVPVPKAEVRLAGHSYGADAQGRALLPFTVVEDGQEAPAADRILLVDPRDGFCQPAELPTLKEEYDLVLTGFVPGEALRAGQVARILVQPSLFLGDRRIDPAKVLDPVITVETEALGEGNSVTAKTLRPAKLAAGLDIAVEFLVPENTNRVRIRIEGEILATTGKRLPVESGLSFPSLEKRGPAVANLFLVPTPDGVVAEMRGLNGELLPGRGVELRFQRGDFAGDRTRATLRTDAAGQVLLGAVPEDATVTSWPAGAVQGIQRWEGFRGKVARPITECVTARPGAATEIPAEATADDLRLGRVRLSSGRDGLVVEDVSDKLSLVPGGVAVAGLPAGRYDLVLPSHAIALDVVDGPAQAGFVMDAVSTLAESAPRFARIVEARAADGKLRVQVANPTDLTRLHLVGTRFAVGTDELLPLLHPDPGAHLASLVRYDNVYLGGRDISDEYRYILDRRGGQRFPGVALEKPGLLLNPWETGTTETGVAEGRRGTAYEPPPAPATAPAPRPEARPRGMAGEAREKLKEEVQEEGLERAARHAPPRVEVTPSFDFLAEGAVHQCLPVPENGRVEVDLAAFAGKSEVVIALSDAESYQVERVALPKAGEAKRVDRRLKAAANPGQAMVMRERVVPLAAGATLTLPGDTLPEVGLLESVRALEQLPSWADSPIHFGGWNGLDADRRREFYHEHACHELHLFLFRYDRPFFDQVVKPYLAGKHEKTFIDHFLLGHDLSPFLELDRFSRLNALEIALLGCAFEGKPEASRIRQTLLDQANLHPVDRAAWRDAFAEAIGSGIGQAAPGGGADPFAATALAELPALAGGAAKMAADDAFKDAAVRQETEKKAPVASRKAAEAALAGFQPMAVPSPLYREIGPARIYAEGNYHHTPTAGLTPELVTPSPFWEALGRWDGKQPFLSEHLVGPRNSATASLARVAFSGLPLAAGDNKTERAADGTITIKAATPLLALVRDVVPATPPQQPGTSSVLVRRELERLDQPTRQEGDRRVALPVDEPLLVGVPYRMRILFASFEGGESDAGVLARLPEGAVPLDGTKRADGGVFRLQGYQPQTIEMAFYFPAPGEFALPAACAADKDGRLLAEAAGRTLMVVAPDGAEDRASWTWLAGFGEPAAVLDHLAKANLFVPELDLTALAWRMQDKEFFGRALQALSQRERFDPALWSYALLHRDRTRIGEYFRNAAGAGGWFGAAFTCPLFTLDPVARLEVEHLDFRPAINARRHVFGSERTILNDQVRANYQQWLARMAARPALDDNDRLTLVVFLFLQDRVDDALPWFDKVDRAKVASTLAYDYCRCHVLLHREQATEAGKLAQAYAGHPVKRWRDLFGEVAAQVAAATGGKPGGAPAKADPERKQATHDLLAASEPVVTLEPVDGGAAMLGYQQVAEVELCFYPVDLELMFSKTPFLSSQQGEFRLVQPAVRRTLKPDPAKDSMRIEVPDELQRANVVVEARAAGKTATAMVSRHRLRARAASQYGMVEVADATTGKPVPKAYVKVYAKGKDGRIAFHKDGYTDLRGRFDFASLNTGSLDAVERLAILVSDDERGSVVIETPPPGHQPGQAPPVPMPRP